MISINRLEKGKERYIGEERYIVCIDSFNKYAVLNDKEEFIEGDEDACLFETLKEAEEVIYNVATLENYKYLKIQKLICNGIIFIYSNEYWLKKYAYIDYSGNNMNMIRKEYKMK